MRFFKPVLALALILCSAVIFAQQELTNWHFGQGIGLDFSGDDPVLDFSNSAAGTYICPTSISDSNGNLLLYCDGTNVYNGNHDVIFNGTFNNLSNENLLVKDPGNSDLYYLFRSHGANTVDYSIIDLTMDGGNGGIAEGNKDIFLFDKTSEFVSARNENGIDQWIITADNNNGNAPDEVHLNIYSLTADGLTLVDEFSESFFFAGWNGALDDVRLSPDCSTIAISYKGHYICMLKFDNSTGETYDVMLDELDTGASFVNITEIEFSPNSEYIYALGDYNTIRQYNITDWNIAAIQASATVIIQGNGNTSWNDLKLAPNGKIYLANSGAAQLDVMNSPNLQGEDVDFEAGVLEIPVGITTYFPNTPNILCGEPFLDLQILHQYVCLGDSTEIWYSFPFEADSVSWEFGDPASGSANTSTEDETIHVFTDIGTYDVQLFFYLNGVETIYDHEITIYDQPVVDLGNNVQICAGENVTLNSGYPNYDNLWSNGDTGSMIVVATEGEYWVEVDNNGCVDGDTMFVSVTPYAVIDLGDWIITCEDDPITLTANTEGLDNITWNTGATSESIVVSSSGFYWASGDNDCFSASDSILVEFIDVPQSFLPGDAQLCEGDTLVVNIAYPNWDVDWDNGGNDNPLIITESGEYSATISYGDCSSQDEFVVEMFQYVSLDDIEMPNVFSPNQDDKNAEIRPFLRSNPDYPICSLPTLAVDMQVYNRWGNLIEDDACSWRGDNGDGDPMAEGVYYYIVDLKSLCLDRDEELQKAGHFTLLRK